MTARHDAPPPGPEAVTAAGIPGVERGATSVYRRARPIAIVAALHTTIWLAVNRLNELRDPSVLWDFSTPVDAAVPYMGWTTFVYYLGDLYILPWAAFVLWKLDSSFRRAIRAYAGMVIAGGVVQLSVPAAAPFPPDFHWFQAGMHEALSIRPFACLPSMHVALSVLPACLSLHVLRSPWARGTSVLAAVLVSASTFTAKEHYFLDAVAGAALALLFYGWWRLGSSPSPDAPGRPEA